ncbi:MAG TPA: Arc family DNA-binding protein [Anaerolineales bacterium]|jgi:plasmid stability protein|nr:Arc family DNA-binding protein [Anaerolineales bacterium]
MATITVKNIPNDLYEQLKRSAEAHRRSINSEIIACIEQAVQSRQLDPEAILVRAQRLREKTAHYRVTDEGFSKMKREGRP